MYDLRKKHYQMVKECNGLFLCPSCEYVVSEDFKNLINVKICPGCSIPLFFQEKQNPVVFEVKPAFLEWYNLLPINEKCFIHRLGEYQFEVELGYQTISGVTCNHDLYQDQPLSQSYGALNFNHLNKKEITQYGSVAFLDLDGTLTAPKQWTEKGAAKMDVHVLNVLSELKKCKILLPIFNSGRPATACLFTSLMDNKIGLPAFAVNGFYAFYFANRNGKKVQICEQADSGILGVERENLMRYLRENYCSFLNPIYETPDKPVIELCLPSGVDYHHFRNFVKKDWYLNNLTPGGYAVIQGGKGFVCITKASLNKGSIINKFLEVTGFPLEKTIAVGNHYNDHQAFDAAGNSGAVGDANEDTFYKANYTSDKSSSYGTLDIIRSFLIKTKIINETEWNTVITKVYNQEKEKLQQLKKYL